MIKLCVFTVCLFLAGCGRDPAPVHITVSEMTTVLGEDGNSYYLTKLPHAVPGGATFEIAEYARVGDTNGVRYMMRMEHTGQPPFFTRLP